MVCVSGGVPFELPLIQAAYQREIPITNDAILFLERCPAKVIGITGSAGKTTTTTLTGEMCKQAGIKTWVGGNIGHVLLDDLVDIQPDDVVVMELSSFQLEISDVSPPIAAILNITPNHLDRHESMDNYIQAKSHIYLHQNTNDLFVFGRDDLVATTCSDKAKGHLASFSIQQLVSDGACMVGNRLMLMGNCSPTGMAKMICEQGDIQLRGAHNLKNILAACALAGSAGIPVEAMREAIINFRGVPHRLEVIADIQGVKWINDSIATSPERVIAALQSFKEPLILLAGGRDKHLPWEDLARLAVARCKGVICFGEYGEAIAEHIRRASSLAANEQTPKIFLTELLDDAVHEAANMSRSGDVVLLSPGCTSYDAYRDFEARGEHFRKLVERLYSGSGKRS
jgi:UDP-N-acetylmuramoylalanine--D-glutamate ligase